MFRLALATGLLLFGANAALGQQGADAKKKRMKEGATPERISQADFEKVQEKAGMVLEQLLLQEGPTAVCDGKCENEVKCEKYLAWARKNPTAYWAETVGQNKPMIKAVAPLVVDRYAAAGAGSAQQAILLDFVSATPGLAAPDLVGQLWAIDPAGFSETHLLGLASKANAGMVQALAKRCAKYEEDPEAHNLGPALWFAVRGDARGEKTLVRAWKKADFAQCVARPTMAAFGLERLGHEGLVAKTLTKTHDAVLAALDAGHLDAARTMALQAEFFAGYVQKTKKAKQAKGEGPCVVWLSQGMQDHCMARAQEVASAKAIFQLIEKVSPSM